MPPQKTAPRAMSSPSRSDQNTEKISRTVMNAGYATMRTVPKGLPRVPRNAWRCRCEGANTMRDCAALSSRPTLHRRVGLFSIPHFPCPSSLRSGVSGMNVRPKNDVAELPSHTHSSRTRLGRLYTKRPNRRAPQANRQRPPPILDRRVHLHLPQLATQSHDLPLPNLR
jgi:hypothetical protein